MTEDPLIGQVLAERYRIIRTLGEGGMGRVYLAEHVRMGRLSAVKVMSPSLAPTDDAISRFNREAANASRINHPNVAAIYDFGETPDGVLYLAMEYVEGETLAALLRRSGALTVQQTAYFVRQIASALNAAHLLGIVHRDLKPDNILIARDPDGHDVVKVVDFGIAKTVQGGGQTVTTVGMSIGTPEYMSPEQLAGEPLDPRTDIYSLGLVAFTMLTNELAYPHQTSKQSLVQRLTTRPRPLAEVRPAAPWPPRLQGALDRALSPEPADRYARVGDFATDVAAAAEGIAAMGDARTRAMTPLGLPVVKDVAATVAAPVGKPRGRGALVAAAIAAVIAGTAFALSGDKEEPVAADTSSAVAAAAATVDAAPAATVVAPPRDTAAPTRTPVTRSASEPAPRPVPKAAAVAPTDVPMPAVAVSESLPTVRPDSGNVSIAAREVMAHVIKARQLFKARQPALAGPELRLASERFAAFAAENPNTRETMMLRQQIIGTARQALGECKAARDSAALRDRTVNNCEALERGLAAATQPGRPGGAAPFGGRRNQRPRPVAP